MAVTVETVRLHELRSGDMVVRLNVREGVVEWAQIVAMPAGGDGRGSVKISYAELNDLRAILDEITARGL